MGGHTQVANCIARIIDLSGAMVSDPGQPEYFSSYQHLSKNNKQTNKKPQGIYPASSCYLIKHWDALMPHILIVSVIWDNSEDGDAVTTRKELSAAPHNYSLPKSKA